MEVLLRFKNKSFNRSFNRFLNEKKQALSKTDKSRKASIDAKIKQIITLINKSPFFYTTSSCSGRALLMQESFKKMPSAILFSWHDKLSMKELLDAIEIIKKNLKSSKSKSERKAIIYFKFESPIIHVKAFDIDKLALLCQIARDSGFKESGFYFISKRRFPIAEIKASEALSLPIFYKDLLLDKNYIRVLVSETNKRFKQAERALKKFERALKALKTLE
ncbi:MAG: tRNA wybutosine-synthesizing 3 family protein [Candidatus Pacearchaeota archaeon]